MAELKPFHVETDVTPRGWGCHAITRAVRLPRVRET
jgi:hypothetical protein